MNISPGKVLVFLFASFLSIIVFSVVAGNLSRNSGEICLKIGSSENCLKFFTISEIVGYDDFKSNQTQANKPIVKDSVLEAKTEELVKSMDSPNDSLEVLMLLADNDSSRFWLPSNDRKFWNEIFSEWEVLKRDNKIYRILHHGDSQIEMDRMTSHIRNKLQSRFGGSGPGFLPPLQLIPASTIQQSSSATWRRFVSYGLQENKASHRNYGATGMIFSFDSGYASVNISANLKRDSILGKFETLKVITGRMGKSVQISVSARNNKFNETVFPDGAEQITEWELAGSPSSVNLVFRGDSASEVLGIAIDGKYGIAMDNIPWRGSSGTTFTTISKSSLVNTYSLLGVKMVILQFGGNSVPYIKSEKAIAQFVNGFKKQIDYIHSADSTIKILVIGPADMSYNDKGEMMTYPLLEKIVEQMRIAANNSGAAFWSMYHSMGGHNSMVRWVNAYPALASPDYIHFTPKGSELASQVLYKSIEREYEIYKRSNALYAQPGK